MKKIISQTVFVAAFLSIFVIFAGCSNDSANPSTMPYIALISPQTAYLSDTITIWGTNFGNVRDSGSVYIDTNLIAKGDSAVFWDNAKIRIILKNYVPSGKLYVIIAGDTSNKIDINIQAYKPFDLAIISACQFSMGSIVGLPDELPVHAVTLSKDFYLSKIEVTCSLWQSVMGNNPSANSGSYPVTNVSWFEAIEFCNKFSKMQGLQLYYTIASDSTVAFDSNASGWRLPTEAEWECACRAGTLGDYAGFGDLDSLGWYSSNSGYAAHPVAAKEANQFGVYDMHGNVWEWCWDWYDASYYSNSPASDPKGPSSGSHHVQRGGAYDEGAAYCRSSSRGKDEIAADASGFRIARNKTSR
jgi:formylglycine-generating enzyme required for sulfatase activity